MKQKTDKIIFFFFLLFFIFLTILYYVEPFDDAFISYRVAHNLQEGRGFLFNPQGEKVEGFSNFLWVIILAFFSFLNLNIVNSSLILGIWLSLGTIFLSYQLAKKIFPKYALFVPFFIGTTDFFVRNSANGLETSLFTFLFILSCSLFLKALSPSSYSDFYLLLTSLSTFLLSLTRPEGPLIFFVITLFLIKEEAKNLPQGFKKIIIFVLPFFIFYIAYFSWRHTYFGYILPNTYYARHLILFANFADQLLKGGSYLFNFFKSQVHFFIILIFSLFLFNKNVEREFKLLNLLLFTYIIFILFSGGDWHHMTKMYRFMMPLVPLISLIALKIVLFHFKKKFVHLIPLALLFLLTLPQIKFDLYVPSQAHLTLSKKSTLFSCLTNKIKYPQNIKHQIVNFLTNKGSAHLDAKVGLWLKKYCDPNSLLASQQAGRLAFFSKTKFLDIDGLVNKTIAHMTRDDFRSKKYLDYIFNLSPNYFVFPVTKLKTASLYNPYLKKYNYTLTKIFCDKNSLPIFKTVYKNLYANRSYQFPNNLSIYFLCLFEKRKKEKRTLNKKNSLNLIFEDSWYSIEEKDLILF
ncbi:hypothetical protein ACFLQ1_00790 [Candidatus Auribacterota bacterium]